MQNEENGKRLDYSIRLGLSSFEVESENDQKYYRTVLLSCKPAQLNGVIKSRHQAYRYHFNLNNTPKGTIIVDSNKKDIAH